MSVHNSDDLQRIYDARAEIARIAELERQLDEARAAMSVYLGCARDDLVFVPNATIGNR